MASKILKKAVEKYLEGDKTAGVTTSKLSIPVSFFKVKVTEKLYFHI